MVIAAIAAAAENLFSKDEPDDGSPLLVEPKPYDPFGPVITEPTPFKIGGLTITLGPSGSTEDEDEDTDEDEDDELQQPVLAPPAPPGAPAPDPIAVAAEEAAAEAAARAAAEELEAANVVEQERVAGVRRAAARRGRKSTIKTGGLGLANPGMVAHKTLLGA